MRGGYDSSPLKLCELKDPGKQEGNAKFDLNVCELDMRNPVPIYVETYLGEYSSLYLYYERWRRIVENLYVLSSRFKWKTFNPLSGYV